MTVNSKMQVDLESSLLQDLYQTGMIYFGEIEKHMLKLTILIPKASVDPAQTRHPEDYLPEELHGKFSDMAADTTISARCLLQRQHSLEQVLATVEKDHWTAGTANARSAFVCGYAVIINHGLYLEHYLVADRLFDTLTFGVLTKDIEPLLTGKPTYQDDIGHNSPVFDYANNCFVPWAKTSKAGFGGQVEVAGHLLCWAVIAPHLLDPKLHLAEGYDLLRGPRYLPLTAAHPQTQAAYMPEGFPSPVAHALGLFCKLSNSMGVLRTRHNRGLQAPPGVVVPQAALEAEPDEDELEE